MKRGLATTVTVLVKEGARKVKKNLAVDLPHYFYPSLIEVGSFKSDGSLKREDPLFGYYAKKELKDTLTQKIKGIFEGHNLSQILLEHLSKGAHRWVKNNRDISRNLKIKRFLFI